MKLLPKLLAKVLGPDEIESLKPFLSVFVIVSSLFVIVFAKMEERRIGYTILKLTHQQKEVVEEKRIRELTLAKMTRPQQVEKYAHDRLTLKKVQNSQIIQLTGGSSYSEPTERTSESEL